MDELFQEVNESETVTIDQNADYLAELVGEGKKFKTPHDLARGKAESDRYVEILKNKILDLEKEVNTRTSLDSFKTALEELRKPVQPVEPQQQSIPDSQAPKFDEQSLESLLESILNKKEAQRLQETNSQKVSRVLEENFGPRAQNVLNEKAREVGMSLSEMKDLAARAPQAFFRLVGAQEGAQRPVQTGAVPAGSHQVNSSQPSGVRGKSYYERMKREQPTLYNDPKTVSQMINDARTLGLEKYNAS